MPCSLVKTKGVERQAGVPESEDGDSSLVGDALAGFALFGVVGCWLWLALAGLLFPMVMLDDSGRAAANVSRVARTGTVGLVMAIVATIVTVAGYRKRRPVLLGIAIGCLVITTVVGLMSFPHASG